MTLRKGRFPAAMEQCRERDAVSDSGRIFRRSSKVGNWAPLRGPNHQAPGFAGDTYSHGRSPGFAGVAVEV